MGCTIDYIRTDLARIGTERPSPVFLSFVEEEALLGIVGTCHFTGLRLKVIEIYIGDYIIAAFERFTLNHANREDP